MAAEILADASVGVTHLTAPSGLGRELEHITFTLIADIDFIPIGAAVGAETVPLAVGKVDQWSFLLIIEEILASQVVRLGRADFTAPLVGVDGAVQLIPEAVQMLGVGAFPSRYSRMAFAGRRGAQPPARLFQLAAAFLPPSTPAAVPGEAQGARELHQRVSAARSSFVLPEQISDRVAQGIPLVLESW